MEEKGDNDRGFLYTPMANLLRLFRVSRKRQREREREKKYAGRV
jgi:hypothetical protein